MALRAPNPPAQLVLAADIQTERASSFFDFLFECGAARYRVLATSHGCLASYQMSNSRTLPRFDATEFTLRGTSTSR